MKKVDDLEPRDSKTGKLDFCFPSPLEGRFLPLSPSARSQAI